MAQQPFYPTDDEVGFDSQSKRDAVSMPHTIPSDSQQELLDRTLSSMDTGAELEVKNRGPTRRRIQVACVRCRKRKIKCSGDGGDGQGCSNCRSAGNTPCQFLRVNSFNSSIMPTKVHSAGSGWLYPPSDMVSQRSGIYAASVACKVGALPAKTSSHRTSTFLRVPDHEVASDSPNPYGRQSFSIESTINYEDEPATPYNVLPPSGYLLPNSPQVLITDYCGLGWSSRNWSATLHGERAHGETMLSEVESVNSLVHPTYSCVIPGEGGQVNEALSIATIPASMTSSAQETERTLPNPASRHTHGLATASDDVHGLPSTPDYRLGSRWRSEIRSPIQPTSNVSLCTATGKQVKVVPSGALNTSFGLLPGTSSNASSPLVQSSGAFANSEAIGSATDPDDGLCGALDSRLRTCSLEHNKRARSPSHYRADYYGYTRPAYRARLTDDVSSESTLITGLPYERPKHPMPITTFTPDEFSDYKILPHHFSTPVPTLSNLNDV
ncbi:hypothetical protein BJX63DRAFT_14426 [Aspergillus granulosus]|uniref:Zn(2)-C6 fungal-type domain-containing protein n=1 Tax=Aspergillus granulosus TaxID=176169 RepID=A0ABR4H0K8_9EURO